MPLNMPESRQLFQPATHRRDVMQRLSPIDVNEANERARELLEEIETDLGGMPNMLRTMAHSPAVLEAYMAFHYALRGGHLPLKLREQIAITVAAANRSDYDLCRHTKLGRIAGLNARELVAARVAQSDDAQTTAALVFARRIVTQRGGVIDADMDFIRDAGYTDAEIAEIIAHVALNNFSNQFNAVVKTELDLPEVALVA
jgi:uncharacterized peroxidase-related enzyme